MQYYHVSLPREGAWECLNELGESESLQLIDPNPHEAAFNRPFASQIRRCEEIENKLQQIEAEMKRFNKPIHKQESVHNFLKDLKSYLQ